MEREIYDNTKIKCTNYKKVVALKMDFKSAMCIVLSFQSRFCMVRGHCHLKSK